MDEKLRSKLRQAILQSLPTLHDLEVNFSEPYLIWSKQVDGSWNSKYQQRPSLRTILAIADEQLNENGAAFTEEFYKNYPEYKGMVGVDGFIMMSFGNQPAYIFKAAIGHIWERYGTFDIDEGAVNAVIEEVVEFVNQPTIKYRFQAQLLNFNLNSSTLVLPDNLIIRRLNEQEISAFHGGSLTMPGINPSPIVMIHEFVLEGEGEAFKSLGDFSNEANPASRITSLLNKAILCLRTFKKGPIGYNYIHVKPLHFCPLPLTSYVNIDLYVPFGTYEVTENEITQLQEYAKLIFRVSEPAMEMACNRLADAEIRTRDQDRIVDAVIGMEALLLAGLGQEDRKGELKYRFSLHYSTLFHSPQDRYNAFRMAKDLYDLRSAIAHGSSLKKDLHRIGEEKLSLSDASERAIEALRRIIKHFLPEVESTPYKKTEFWDRAYFKLE